MKIIQILPTLSYGDAIGNHTRTLKSLFQDMGYFSEIYAEILDSRLPKNTGFYVRQLPELKETDILLYHLSTGTKLNKLIASLKCRKIVQYHNITPPSYFSGYSLNTKRNIDWGLIGARYLADKMDYAWADSDFNKEDLRKLGYKQKIDVLPILISFADYERNPSKAILDKYSDGWTNILFTGRIAPNKKQEDIIKIFFYYKKYFNTHSRLFLVGTYQGMEKYYEKLKQYVHELDLEDVYFTGHIPFEEILAYYRIANVFVCMSEHEGFCVPLVEAMYFGIPILAYSSSAIPSTLGKSGILLEERNPKLAAEWIDKMTKDPDLCNYLKSQQNLRLKDLQYDTVARKYRTCLIDFIDRGAR